MSKRKKSVSLSAEKVSAVTAISALKNTTETEIIESLINDFIMENMSLLVGELNKLQSPKEAGK